MKTIMKAALILGLASFAFFASAQNPSATVTPGQIGANLVQITTSSADSIKRDFVTVGSTMPYLVDGGQTNLQQWATNAADLGLPNLATSVTALSRWTVQRIAPGAVGPVLDFTAVDNRDTIFVNWPETGGFRLTRTNSVAHGGTAVCGNAVSTKDVWVLPAPNVLPAGIVGHGAILHCDTTSHIVGFNVRGIGQIQVRYEITRRRIDGTDAEATRVSSAVGTTETDVDFFTNRPWAEVNNIYETGTGTLLNITVPNLLPGYVYRVEIVGVADQISRKSFVYPYMFRPVEGPAIFATFAVVPQTTSTRIEHVSNQFGANPYDPTP